MINAIALDDEPIALDIITNFCERSEKIRLDKTFSIPSDALKYLNKFPVDLIFLDINMPSISGLEFSAKIKKGTLIIFTTAYSEYAVEGFEIKAVDYLLKPFSFERFEMAVDRAADFMALLLNKATNREKYVSFRIDYSLVDINVDEIDYIECFADYVKLFFTNRKSLLLRITMKDLISKLPSSEFVRVHRSYIINIRNIVSIRNKKIQLKQVEIPIGQSYLELTNQLFKE
ncbi:MAG: response regulator transcription factor [Chitinophagaceae bacterium]|nr:response regulator transcription factor [Chitinophagaceae bacterium]